MINQGMEDFEYIMTMMYQGKVKQGSLEDILELQQKRKCQKCKNDLEQCEIQQDFDKINCKSCRGQKCSKCQKFYNYQLSAIEREIYCQECIKCHECNKQGPRSMSGSFFYHDDCLKISKNSTLRKEMIVFIKEKMKTKCKKGDNIDNKLYYFAESYPFLQIPNYSGYVIGYNHPIIKDRQQLNPQTMKLSQDQVDKYLKDEIDEFEKQLYNFYGRKNKQIEVIPENVRMLMLFILFVFKDLEQTLVLNLANLQTFNRLYCGIEKIQFPNKLKVANMIKTHVELCLDFFKDRFHRENGEPRQLTLSETIKKFIPTKKRN